MMNALPFAFAGLLATLTVTLARAMAKAPDQRAVFSKPLNMLVTAALGWSAVALNAAYSVFRFGLVVPGFVAVLLYGVFRYMRAQDLVPYYRFSIGFGAVAVIVTILVLSQSINIRST